MGDKITCPCKTGVEQSYMIFFIATVHPLGGLNGGKATLEGDDHMVEDDEFLDGYEFVDGTWFYNCRECGSTWEARDLEESCSCGSTNIGGTFKEDEETCYAEDAEFLGWAAEQRFFYEIGERTTLPTVREYGDMLKNRKR